MKDKVQQRTKLQKEGIWKMCLLQWNAGSNFWMSFKNQWIWLQNVYRILPPKL